MIDVAVINTDQWSTALGRDLAPAINVGLLGVGKLAENIVAPYPPAPSPSGDTWYERGYGPKRRRKDGSVTGRKTSEMLGRRWTIASRSRMVVVLMNTASYAANVHDSEEQSAVMQAIGWKTDADADREITPGQIEDVMIPPIVNFLVGGL
ncbi:hypothetical protein [Herpetosiphon geysericola]|uniref:Uncharacterized protein n=1 Tax=Herpetosiphon geysericola TaxID=70996 RepID=A0A0P6Z196_9CHLR|nr:hypothetical protein [Herpetosiphon geysericola]KPL90764.1 hypothetical protein SE18_05200 [Herpetosiphon geysericola]